jgi:hypothetical protein
MSIEDVDDHDVEREIQERGPFSAIADAAVILLHDVEALDQICEFFHPELGSVRAELSFEHQIPRISTTGRRERSSQLAEAYDGCEGF